MPKRCMVYYARERRRTDAAGVTSNRMLSFQSIDLDNIMQLSPYLAKQPFRTCDYTIGAIFQWRAYFRSRFAFTHGVLVMLADYADEGHCYTFPVGEGDLDAALADIEQDAAERGLTLTYCAVPEEGLAALQARYGARCAASNRRDWADYLYNLNDLVAFPGKKYHTQRNHLNRFVKENPDYRYVPVTAETMAAASAFMDEYEQHAPIDKVIEAEEMLRARELLRDALALNQRAGYIETGGRIVALAIGEVIGDTLYVHVEKARLDYAGAYQAIVSLFAKNASEADTLYTNREDDSGEDGLRFSKLAYRPIRLIDKYWVTVTK